MIRRLRLTIDSRLGNISLVGATVNKICSMIPLSEVDSYQVELCVVETCDNTILKPTQKQV